MTVGSSGFGSVSTVLGILLAVPLFMMGVVMPLIVLVGGGQPAGSLAGWQLLVPVIPLTLLGVLSCALYVHGRGSDEQRGGTDGPLEELRSAYARGDLSHEQFEQRRDRLRAPSTAADTSEDTRHE